MSNPEKQAMDIEELTMDISYYSDSSCSFEDGEIREIVLALPALSVTERSHADDKISNEAAVAANLIVEAARVAEEKKKKKTDQTVNVTSDVSKCPVSKKSRRPRVLVEAQGEVSGSVGFGSIEEKEPVKKARRKSCSQLTNPPPGTPTCPVCGKVFISLKAVFGHLRLHKDRGYTGFLPPPTFNAAEEGFGGGIAASSSSGLGIDLNVPVEEEEERRGSRVLRNFDLNKEPQDEDEEENEDNAE